MTEQDETFPWVIIQLGGQQYALPTSAVRELVRIKELTPVPGSPSYIRGLLNLRGTVLPVIDLRVCMGLPTSQTETDAFCKLMTDREEDHLRWIAELEASVRERRPFKLTTDHAACAFGRWYATFRSDKHLVTSMLAKFDAPHRAIHAMGAVVEKLKAEGAYDQAMAAIDALRTGELATMRVLFEKLRALVKEEMARETLVVLDCEGVVLATSIDNALSVERLKQFELVPEGARGEEAMVTHLARRGASDRPVLLVEAERLRPLARSSATARA